LEKEEDGGRPGSKERAIAIRRRIRRRKGASRTIVVQKRREGGKEGSGNGFPGGGILLFGMTPMELVCGAPQKVVVTLNSRIMRERVPAMFLWARDVLSFSSSMDHAEHVNSNRQVVYTPNWEGLVCLNLCSFVVMPMELIIPLYLHKFVGVLSHVSLRANDDNLVSIPGHCQLHGPCPSRQAPSSRWPSSQA